MTTNSFLTAVLTDHIHAVGRHLDWWPFNSREQLAFFLKASPISIQRLGDHILVGLNHSGKLVVQELRDVTDMANVSEQAFTLSYRDLLERATNDTSL